MKKTSRKSCLAMSILLAGSVCLLPYEMVMASELLIEWGRTFGGSGRDGSDSVRESSDNREATAKKIMGILVSKITAL